jgi:hypothetical protein
MAMDIFDQLQKESGHKQNVQLFEPQRTVSYKVRMINREPTVRQLADDDDFEFIGSTLLESTLKQNQHILSDTDRR